MNTSDAGIDFIKRHEGVVLRAYRDVAGVWTIGAGLTAASGVVTPRPGMTITAEDAMRLLKRALARNYEPRVTAAMPGASQHAFDGGVSFDFNTGAIDRATWVKRWRAKDPAGVRSGLMQWVKAGGKVVSGLKRRRAEEADLINRGHYGAPSVRSLPVFTAAQGVARITVSLTPDEVSALQSGFKALGFDVGPSPVGISEEAVRSFQALHDLTVDGVIGRATIATLQRQLDATRKAKGAAAAVAGGTAVTPATPAPDLLGVDPTLGWLALAAALIWAGWLAWTYRDAIAARVQTDLPALAAKLRSF